jgi:hypothetical protein
LKNEILSKLLQFKSNLRNLKQTIASLPGNRVNRIGIRNYADAIASEWVEEIRSILEHKFRLSPDIIQSTSEQMKKLHILSRPNNLKDSYIRTINAVLEKFDDKFILPIKQFAIKIEKPIDLQKIIPNILNQAESEYMQEAIDCASSGYKKASIVMGWCAAIDKIQKKIMNLGLDVFNNTSKKLKSRTTGKFKHFNKEYNLAILSDLQTVFDNDLITIIEGMGIIDGNQAERLKICFQYRNHSAHPGNAPIEDPHLLAFFSDISLIVLHNPKFNP